MSSEPVFAAPPSFAADAELCRELRAAFPGASWNTSGRRLEGDALVAALADARAAIVGLERVDAELLDRCPRLELIAKYGVGLDGIDLEACRARGVEVRHTPGVNRRSVAEVALGFLLGAAHGLFEGMCATRSGAWEKPATRLLSGRTVGVLGLGAIGRDLVGLLAPFGCTLLGHDIADRADFGRTHDVRIVSRDALLAESDFVSLHVPLSAATSGFIDRDALARMRASAWLINTARGALVDEDALLEALRAGRLAGAVADVLACEPPAERSLLEHPRFHCTPHLAGSAREAVLAMGRAAIAHLSDWFEKSEPEGGSA